MASSLQQELLQTLPSIDELLGSPRAVEWLNAHPPGLVTDCLRQAVDDLRRHILNDDAGRCGAQHVTADHILDLANEILIERTQPHVRPAINATGIILHTALGRAVLPESAVDAMVEGMKGYVTLAIDRETGQRSERDQRVEGLLTELTGAEAATVVNNNAAATMLVLAALAAEQETIVSRGQLIEIGGSFRLPDVMAQSRTRMVEVGATNRTHLRDYENAITEDSAVIFRAHPSNYRVVGFASTPELPELVALGHKRGLTVVDDLGAGALVDLERFGLPHEPTMRESIEAGADVVLASADKLMGAGQGGVIVGRKHAIDLIRKHPLARAFRADKLCLMALERTLPLFRDPDRLAEEHPTFHMLATSAGDLLARAKSLAAAIKQAGGVNVELAEGVGYLGSGSLPMEALPTHLVTIGSDEINATDLARRLRLDEACVFSRIDNDRVVFDVRTITDAQVSVIAAAVGRCAG